MADCKQEFLNIYNTFIKRDGAKELLKYLENSDFFTAPASSNYHCAEEGGLCEHSVNVYKRLLNFVSADFGENYTDKWSNETIAICGLLHDLCKVNYYTVEYRNAKENGTWVQKPYYKVDEKFPYGHGEKSVFIINQFMKLSAEEAMAINWHMGGFDSRVQGGSYSASEAFSRYKLTIYMHIADFTATYIDEERGTKL